MTKAPTAKRTTGKTSAVKKPAAQKSAAKTPASKTAPKPTPKAEPKAQTDYAAELRTELTKKQLIERMMQDSDMKKGEARRAADATLLALANVLRSGADIAAAPLGKIKITKQKETANGDLVVCRIKLKSPDADADMAAKRPAKPSAKPASTKPKD